MELTDNILKLLGILSTASTLYLLIRKAPTDLRSGKISAEDQGFGLYTKAMNELAERDEGFSALREKLAQEITRGDGLEESIKQLRRTNNANADEIDKLKADLTRANSATADFKSKWEQAAREIKILRVILSRNGLLTPEIEAEIATELEQPPDTPPTP